ncbi:hypothetical protein CICLE_v10004073mg [Citrus x clementina]|uniref:Uncharacterized protein n=1 Tax=Citrus clementina TaxID=85681 RepID=V4SL22_CITCL|nr:hypothetical protein CICLE_v10004073mg [Citrus x clementina]
MSFSSLSFFQMCTCALRYELMYILPLLRINEVICFGVLCVYKIVLVLYGISLLYVLKVSMIRCFWNSPWHRIS